MAELVDALGSGLSWGNPVEVQVLSSAPDSEKGPVFNRAFFCWGERILGKPPVLAERVGFEPTDPCGSTVFKTVAIDHSATSP